jgi:murein DD-endopeptidase MepM/ murein hydrolase activator NlpD
LIYEKRTRDGIDAGTGLVRAGRFTNNGKALYAFLYEQEEGKPSYFNEAGESMVKAFLRAPLEYKRITSGYTNARFHPILGRNTTHLAIDYAAAAGTPIMAVGDGVSPLLDGIVVGLVIL